MYGAELRLCGLRTPRPGRPRKGSPEEVGVANADRQLFGGDPNEESRAMIEAASKPSPSDESPSPSRSPNLSAG